MSHLTTNPTFYGAVTLINGPLNLSASQGIYIPSGAPGVTTDKIYSVGGALYFNGGAIGGGGGFTPTRSTPTHTTASIAAGANEASSLTVPQSFDIWKMATDYPARIRIYLNSTYRDADLTRPLGVDPTGDHGMIMEAVTDGAHLSFPIIPNCHFKSLTTPNTTAYITVTNNDTISRAITTTFSVLSEE